MDSLTGFTANDVYYTKPDYCYGNNGVGTLNKDVCDVNKEKHGRLGEIALAHSSANQRYTDMRVYTNRELQFAVNLGAGIFALGYFIYHNKLHENVFS